LTDQIDWATIYPELVNKIRWAICTTMKGNGVPYGYSLGQPMATVLAQDVISAIKESRAESTIPLTTKKVREVLNRT